MNYTQNSLEVFFLNEKDKIEQGKTNSREGQILIRNNMIVLDSGDYIPFHRIVRIKKISEKQHARGIENDSIDKKSSIKI